MRFAKWVLIASLWAGQSFAWQSEVIIVARRILSEVKSTHYTHTTSINERTGKYDTDCSGFAKYVLDKSSRPAAEELERLVPGKRPLAKEFVKIFETHGRSWQSIHYVKNLQLGEHAFQERVPDPGDRCFEFGPR
jgi:hypothetical protein